MKKNNNKKHHSKASGIIRRIRSQNQQENLSIRDIVNFEKFAREEEAYQQGLPLEDIDDESFHHFKEIEHAANAFGLYKEIVNTYKDETDAARIKEIFEENLIIILERMPDQVARDVSAKLNGIIL